ncbi:site-specific DNA-methyltransferase [Listeria innocua]|nr:site-specific DNA-methyltransferase [Listeria innocua]HDA9555247.1 site-specific DNA-methyltransferase [Listeria innocua]
MKCDKGESAVKIEPKIFDELKTVLSSFGDKYFVDEELNRSKLSEDLRNYNEALLEKLFKADFIKQHFIKEIAGQKLFQIEQLEEAILYNDYWDTSYTKYENRIGLVSNGKLLEDSQDVVLDFPFKDGVLTASMTKEDNEDGYDEAFLNEVIEKDEIDRLFDKKIFVNSKRYDENGDSVVTDFNEDKDNLIIKGNNLLALHSLKEKYAGKVKQIIIDPPYYFTATKASDAFNYNSNFKLSTWLVFMKNRLEIAMELLSEKGFIFIVIGEEGLAQLKLLCDQIFEGNYVGMISWRKSDNQANIGEFAKVSDYILIYKKTDSASLNKLPLTEKAKKEYRYSDEKGNFRRQILLDKTRGRHWYELRTPSGNILKGPWMKPKEIILEMDKNNEIYWTKGGEEQPYGKLYLSQSKGQIPNDFWDTSFGSNQRGSTEMKALFENRAFDFPKPEQLIKNLMLIGSSEDDLVIDFFMGSATTQAVAMKMNRRFIGIEQMDYINDVSVPRLQKVIVGEQGGISKEVNWQGGGSFVYTELMPKNMGYLQDIIHSKTLDELKVVYHRMLEGTDTMEPADISFRADLDKIDWMEGFVENKRLLIKLLDKNGLYYNFSEIDDANVRELISDKDYLFNKQFYKGGE